jgi:hypothetical protein
MASGKMIEDCSLRAFSAFLTKNQAPGAIPGRHAVVDATG